MKNLEVLGLEEKKISGVINGLNQLLADLHVYYMNLRGLHWNIKGKAFFQLHAEFENQYNDVAGKIDEVAERLLHSWRRWFGNLPCRAHRHAEPHAG